MPVAARGKYPEEWDTKGGCNSGWSMQSTALWQEKQSTRVTWESDDRGTQPQQSHPPTHKTWEDPHRWELYRDYEQRNLPPKPDPRDREYRVSGNTYQSLPSSTSAPANLPSPGRPPTSYVSPQRERERVSGGQTQQQPTHDPALAGASMSARREMAGAGQVMATSQPHPQPREPTRESHHHTTGRRDTHFQTTEMVSSSSPRAREHTVPHSQPPHLTNNNTTNHRNGELYTSLETSTRGSSSAVAATVAEQQLFHQHQGTRAINTGNGTLKRCAIPCTREGHEQYLCDIFCNVDDTHICLLCLRRDECHRKHKCRAIQAAPAALRDVVLGWLQAAQEQKSELTKISERLDGAVDDLQQNVESEVHKLEGSIDDLKQRLDLAKKQLIDIAKQNTSTEVERLQTLKKDVTQYAAKIDETVGEVQKLNSSSSVAELVHLKKFISLTAVPHKEEALLTCQRVRFKAHTAVSTDKLFDIGEELDKIALPAIYNRMDDVIKDEVDLTGVDYRLYADNARPPSKSRQ